MSRGSKKRDKRKPDSWMPLFFGDFHADTSNLSLELKMAYLNILWWMWRNAARAPNDDEQLASITGLGMKRWRAAKSKLMLFFSVSDNWLFQKRLSEEYDHAWAVYQKRVESGKKGGRPTTEPGPGDLFDETERLPERGAESPPQPQPQPQPASSPTNDANGKIPKEPTDARARAAMQVCKALAEGGVDCSTLDDGLLSLLDDGFQPEQIIAESKTKKGHGKGVAYLTAALRGKRADAKQTATQSTHEPLMQPRPSAEAAAIAAEMRTLENAIYDARHLCDTTGLITPSERDTRISAARARLRELVAADETREANTRIQSNNRGIPQ